MHAAVTQDNSATNKSELRFSTEVAAKTKPILSPTKLSYAALMRGGRNAKAAFTTINKSKFSDLD